MSLLLTVQDQNVVDKFVVVSYWFYLAWFMVLNATFNNVSVISRRSVLLVKEIGVSGENL